MPIDSSPTSPLIAARTDDEASRVSLGHSFYFPSLGLHASLLHVPPAATGEATLTPDALVLRFRGGPDFLRFELNRTQLFDAAWVALYALACATQPLAPTSVYYRYSRVAGTAPGSLKLSSSPDLLGYVTITAYDARRHLLSGYYEVRAFNQPDPTRVTTPTDPTCTILLVGDFDKVRLKY